MSDETTGFSKAEREAIKQYAAELRSQSGVKGAARREKELTACLDAIAALEGLDRLIAERFHVVVSEEAPDLAPKTWYGFPSYARDGKVVTFLQPSSKFNTRYATIGFSDSAQLDADGLWPTSFAVIEWTDAVEETLRALVRRA